MSAKDQVLIEAMRLSEAERAELADALFESLQGPPDPTAPLAWDDEIARRMSDIDAGRAKLVPWDEARRRIAGAADDDAGASR